MKSDLPDSIVGRHKQPYRAPNIPAFFNENTNEYVKELLSPEKLAEYAISLLQDALNEKSLPIKGTRITILGVAYKKNVDDARESPFFEIRKILKEKGAELHIFDSWINSENTSDTLRDALKGSKAIFIVTDHDNYISELKCMELGEFGIEVIVDGRNCMVGDDLAKQGILHRGIGRR